MSRPDHAHRLEEVSALDAKEGLRVGDIFVHNHNVDYASGDGDTPHEHGAHGRESYVGPVLKRLPPIRMELKIGEEGDPDQVKRSFYLSRNMLEDSTKVGAYMQVTVDAMQETYDRM